MTPQEAIDARHSVRAYRDEPIPAQIRQALDAFAAHCNKESGLDIALRYDDPFVFHGTAPRSLSVGGISQMRHHTL